MNYQFNIIVPVFNEVENLQRLTIALNKFIETSTTTTSVLIVNDGSTDGSKQKITEICQKHPHFKSIHFDKNKGLTAALKAGFEHTTTDLVGYIDADLQTNPMDFNLLLAEIPNYDLVTGVRVNRQDSWLKNKSSAIANSIRRAFTNDGMDDTGCPLKVLKTSYAKKMPLFNGFHRFLPALVLLQEGKIHQVPVQHFPRINGTSKFGVWNRLINPLICCFIYVWMRKNYLNYKIIENN